MEKVLENRGYHPLVNKLKLPKESTSSKSVNKLLLKISSRYIGLASITAPFMMPKAHKADKSFDKMERHLYLSPEQIEAIRSKNCVISGFYGTGKTVLLELAAKEVLTEMITVQGKKTFWYKNPKIIFIFWGEGKFDDNPVKFFDDRKRSFKELIKRTKDGNGVRRREDNVSIMHLYQVCEDYQLTMKVPGSTLSHLFSKLKPRYFSLLCDGIKKKYQADYSDMFIVIDEFHYIDKYKSDYAKISCDADFLRSIL